MLPKKGGGVEGVKGDPVRPAMRNPCQQSHGIYGFCRIVGGHYSFNRSSCDFLGIISSI